jgi:hypothetical protein
MCWYSDEDYKKQKIKTCMPLYSQDDGATFGWASIKEAESGVADTAPLNEKPTLADFKANGRYCASGLAYPAGDHLAVCTSFTEMQFYDAEKKTSTKINPVKDGAFPCSPET